MTLDSFVSLATAADQKGVHYQTVRRAIARGDLKALKVGHGVIIASADLEQWHPKLQHAPKRPHKPSANPDPAAGLSPVSVDNSLS